MKCSPERDASSCSGRCARASPRPRRWGAALRTCTSFWRIGGPMREVPAGVEAMLGRDDPELLAGADCSSRAPASRKTPRSCAPHAGRHPHMGRGGTRVPPARGAQSDRRHHRNQRQDHCHAADRRHARARWRAERRGRQRRYGALVVRRRHRAGPGDRVRALELPARGRRAVPLGTWRCCST